LEDCSLVFDSMSIGKKLVWGPNKGKFLGNVDFGDTDQHDLASEVLVVFLLVSLTKRFKCPVAFFMLIKLTVVF